MKYLSVLLMIVLFSTFTSCGKGTTTDNTASMDQAKIKTEDPVQKILDENKLKPLVTLKNANTMELTTKPMDAAVIKEEKKVVEKLAEKFLEYVAQHGLDAALEEVNKSKNGGFKDDLVGAFFYLPICKKTGEKTYTIVAHTTTRDYIGVELNLDKWQDLTGWKYINDAVMKMESGETNRVWIDNVYWKDPKWAGGQPIQFSSYERFFKFNNENYLYHYCLFTYE